MSEHPADTQVKDLKQRSFSNWLENFRKLNPEATPQTWKETLDLLEKQMNFALESHTHSLKAVVAGYEGITGNTEPFGPWFQRLQQGIELCAGTQQRLWNAWFDMLRTAVPGMQYPWTTPLTNWQEMLYPFTLIQEQLRSVQPGLQPAATGKTATRKKKSAAAAHAPGNPGRQTTRRGP